ncbi:hypothetical protein Tco_0787699 [Tanacetum coccineum]
MENVPPNDPNVDTSAIVPAPANPEHALAQPVEEDPGEEEEDSEEEEKDSEEEEEDSEKDPKEDPEEDPEEEPEEGDDEEEEMEVDNEENNLEVIDPVEPLPPVSQFGSNFHGG